MEKVGFPFVHFFFLTDLMQEICHPLKTDSQHLLCHGLNSRVCFMLASKKVIALFDFRCECSKILLNLKTIQGVSHIRLMHVRLMHVRLMHFCKVTFG